MYVAQPHLLCQNYTEFVPLITEKLSVVVPDPLTAAMVKVLVSSISGDYYNVVGLHSLYCLSDIIIL